MKETLELRVNKEFSNLLFKETEGKDSGSFIKVIEVSKDDPRCVRIPIISQQVLEKYKQSFFYGWTIKRKYSPKELDNAKFLNLIIKTKFEPVGEECGTVYDETGACAICGANRKIVGELILRKGSIPKKDISKTIAGEIVVSQRFVDICEKYSIRGIAFNRVRYASGSSEYFMLTVTNGFNVSNQTITGITPFNLSENDGEEVYKCPSGHTVGLNIISELVFTADGLSNSDCLASRQKIGVKRGVLRPESLLLCSQRFRAMVKNEGLTGLDFEVAHVEAWILGTLYMLHSSIGFII